MRNRILLLIVAIMVRIGLVAHAITPDDPGPADVQFTVNSSQDVREISPYIYGLNFATSSSLANRATLDRLGGNRYTGYNWETNASNAGADYYHHSDYHLVNGANNTPPGQAVLGSLTAAGSNDRALVVTVPMAGYVSADANGTVDETQVAPSPRWKQVVAKKETQYPGSTLDLAPNETDGYVFTDEFVNWVETTRTSLRNPPPVFYSLDNEPALWGETLPPGWQSGNPNSNPPVSPSSGGRTHPLIHPYAPTFAEMKNKTIAHASAIKDVAPNSMVFGAVSYGYAEYTILQDAPDRVTSPVHPGGDETGEAHYLEWLLKEVRTEELAQGRKLMDVLDVHWYPEAQGGGVRITENNNSAAVVAARVQAPRSLWDPTYTETSWISQWGTWVGSPGNPGPVRLLPRLQRDINDFNPGTKLAITEYNYGGTNHISGGIAQADALGIFGREGLFAATFWSLYGDSQSQFASGAFKMYLNYDGEGGEFGDVSVGANTSNIANSAVYASVDSTDPSRMILVAINRTNAPLDTGLAVTSDFRFDRAEVFQLTSASANPMQVADILISQLNAFHYTMPAYSVSTLVLHATTTQPGDFDNDGDVDGRDFLVWQRGGSPSPLSASDLADWQANYGASPLASSRAVPEPETTLLCIIGGVFCHRLGGQFKLRP